jgi:hypothetical protein
MITGAGAKASLAGLMYAKVNALRWCATAETCQNLSFAGH